MLAAPCVAQSVDELVAKNISARGGAEKLRAIQTISMTGTITFGDQNSPITVQIARPSKIREEFAVQGMQITRAYNGSQGWEAQKTEDAPQVRDLNGGELNNIREEAENAIEGPLLDYGKKGSKAEYLGKDTVDGKPVVKLKITTSMGTSITQFLDAETYLEIHQEIERSSEGKVVTIVEDVGDYREVNGVKFAHLFVSGSRENPKAVTLKIEKMEVDVPVDGAAFEKTSK